MYQKTKSLGMQIFGMRLFTVLLMWTMVISLVGIIAPAKKAFAANDYSSYIVNSEDTEESLAGKKVIFNGYEWYIIEDNSISATEGSVTLFAVDPINSCRFGLSNDYSQSFVKTYLDELTEKDGSFAGVVDAINDVDLTDVNVTGAKLYLLSSSEAHALPKSLIYCYGLNWWLRSPGDNDRYVACGNGADEYINDIGVNMLDEQRVRPAVQLNLSAVEFTSENRSFKVKHTHDFTYALSGDQKKITAICNGKGDFDCEIKTGLELKISAPEDMIYNGESKPATLNKDYNTTAFPGTYTITYSKQGSSLSKPPVDAGTYTASVTVGEGDDAMTVSVEYTIEPKKVTVSGITASNKVYDGKTDATLNLGGVIVSGTIDGDTLSVSADGVFSDSNAGTDKIVTIKDLSLNGNGKDNYVLAADGQQTETNATIAKKEVTVSGIIASNKVYDGKVNAILYFGNAVISGKIDGDELSVTADGAFSDANIGTNKIVSISNLSLNGSAMNNYVLAEDGNQTETNAVIFAADDPRAYLVNFYDTAEILANKKVIFNGVKWYILADNSTSATEGTVTLLAVDPISVSMFNSYNNNEYSQSIVKSYLDGLTAEGGSFADVAEAIKNVSLGDVGVTNAKLYLFNYYEAQALPEVVRKCNAPDGIEFNAWWLRSHYDEGAAALVDGDNGYVYPLGDVVWHYYGVRPALQLNLSTVEFSSENRAFKVKHKHNFTYSISEDNSTIIAICNGKGDIDCDITTGCTMRISEPEDLVYNGEKKLATLSKDYNTTAFPGTYTITYSKQDRILNEPPVDVGTYTAFVTVGEGDTAKTASLEYTITPKEVTVSGITASDKTYDGSNAATLNLDGATVSGTIEGDNLTVSSADGVFADENAGENKVVTISNYTLTGDNIDNYKLAVSGQQTEVKASITPKSISGATITLDKTETTYNGSEQNVSVSEVKIGDFILTSNDYDICGNKGTDVDDYTVTVTGKGNFTGTASADWKINKADSSVKTAPASKSLKYNGQLQELVTAGEAENCTVYYALGKDAINAPDASAYSTSIPTAEEAGTYYVWYKAVGNDNYNDSKAKCVTSQIIGEISHKVTFKVVNGSWNDGTKEDKTVMLTGHEGDILKLSADQISAAGTKPSNKYKEGAWDITPSSATEITKDITYTYTYEKQDITIVPEPVQNEIIVNLKSVKQKSNKVQVSWSRVKEADGYNVYVHYCKSKAKKPAKTIKKNSVTTTSVNKIDGKKINLKEDFHVYVVAYKMVDGKKVTLAKTVTAHFAGTKSADYTNPKALKLTKSAYSIKAGKTANIKAKVTLADKKKKHLPAWHATKFRYKSSNTKVATVDKNGKIKGKKQGTCYIYVYTINGLMKKVKVTVK